MADDSDDKSSSSDEDTSISEEANSDSSQEEGVRCVKVPLPDNISAHLEKRELVRDMSSITCDHNLIEKVINNYVIARNILRHLPWQEKALCKHVCMTWRSAIQALQREQLTPGDFAVDFQINLLKKSSVFVTEPLVVFMFANSAALRVARDCTNQNSSSYRGRYVRDISTQQENTDNVSVLCCPKLCEQKHCAIDLVQHHVTAPKQCMLTVKAGYLSYLPLQHSLTYQHTIPYCMFRRPGDPFMGGIYIPVIPDVQFHMVVIRSNTNMQRDFYSEIQRLAADSIIKGVLVYVTETFLLHSVEDFDYLNYFKTVQPDVPYALGGCIVEDTMYGDTDINNVIDDVNNGTDFISENLISMGIFTVPKSAVNTEQGEKNNFDIYSLVIDSSDNTKSKILNSITEFSNKVPRFENSIVLKLSCVGRDQRHEVEQKYFRDAFPTTRLIGCYGNGELGLNHPARPASEQPCPMKRQRRSQVPQFGIMYSYSTVFFYIGWGKVTSVCGPIQH